MNKPIYKPTKYHSFKKDVKFYFEEEGQLRGYGMGAYSSYKNIYEISKEEFDKQIIYIDSILNGIVEEDTLRNIIRSLSDGIIPIWQESDDFVYSIGQDEKLIPVRVLYKGRNCTPAYCYGFVRKDNSIIYWECTDDEKGYITYYKEFNTFTDAYKEAAKFILSQYKANKK